MHSPLRHSVLLTSSIELPIRAEPKFPSSIESAGKLPSGIMFVSEPNFSPSAVSTQDEASLLADPSAKVKGSDRASPMAA